MSSRLMKRTLRITKSLHLIYSIYKKSPVPETLLMERGIFIYLSFHGDISKLPIGHLEKWFKRNLECQSDPSAAHIDLIKIPS